VRAAHSHDRACRPRPARVAGRRGRRILPRTARVAGARAWPGRRRPWSGGSPGCVPGRSASPGSTSGTPRARRSRLARPTPPCLRREDSSRMPGPRRASLADREERVRSVRRPCAKSPHRERRRLCEWRCDEGRTGAPAARLRRARHREPAPRGTRRSSAESAVRRVPRAPGRRRARRPTPARTARLPRDRNHCTTA
jgi:hypothetical protein